MNNSIIIESVSKHFGNTKAIDSLSCEVASGELFGFIGPDGAGKTTLFRLIATLLTPTEGRVSVAGFDIVNDYKALRLILGYMPGKFSLYQDLTVEENLNFFASIFKTTVAENYYLIKDIYSQIEPFKNRRAGQLSGGMKQKLALSCALIHKPRVLILDEPTTGVDAVSRVEFWQMLRNIKAMGITIVVSTPYMDEATLCDRVALMQSGKILSVGTPSEIIDTYKEPLWNIRSNNMYKLMTDLKSCDYCKSAYLFGQWLHITLNDKFTIEQTTNWLRERGHTDIETSVTKPNIEDCFIKMSTNTSYA